MTDPAIQPAAHEDAKVDARSAAKWLIASFAAVGAVLLSGLGLSDLGDLEGVDLIVALVAFAVAILSVIIAVILIADVLTPTPVTLKDLADAERKRNEGGKTSEPDLVAYLENNPSFFQGIGIDVDPDKRLDALDNAYRKALEERYRTSEDHWRLALQENSDPKAVKRVGAEFDVADAKAETIHETVRRLERVASAQQTVQRLRWRRTPLVVLALLVAASIAAFALVGSPGDPSSQPTYAADIENVDLQGADLEGADLEGALIRHADFEGAQLQDANIEGSIWIDTTCPDGTESDVWDASCVGHLDPAPVRRPKPLP